MIPALHKDDELLDEMNLTDPGNGFAIWWLGQSGFLLKCAAGKLLLDPYLSDSLTEKYASTDKPHVPMTEIPVVPGRLGGIKAVTSSHNHTDHLDARTLGPLMAANSDASLIIPEANREFVVERLGISPERPVGLDASESVRVGDFEIHAVPAAHEEVERDDNGRCRFLGYVVRFGRWSIYHSGDTVLYDGMEEILRPFAVDLALLPINGRKPERHVSGNLWGPEAARLAHEIGARTVIPCHYDMFTFNTETPDEFVATCKELSQPYAVLRCGECFDSNRFLLA